MRLLPLTTMTSALAALAATASAQVTVIGGGLAHDCYKATKFELDSPAEAEKLCTRALDVEALNLTNKAATYTNRGVLRMRQGKIDAALADYEVAKRLKPDVGATWLNEGAAHILKKDFASALTALDQAIALNATDLHAAYYNRAIARENSGDVEGAYFDFVKAGELKPDWPLVARQLARFTVTTN